MADREIEDMVAAFFRDAMEAAQRAPADVIAADESEPMSDEDLDSALWSSLCGRLDAGSEFSSWPDEVQAYFATRYVDWEVGNGGFRQALANESRRYFPAAIAGYERLGRSDLADLLREALAAPDLAALDALDENTRRQR